MANQSTFAAPQKADNWRAVVGNKLPDGTTDVTEGIYHDGAVHLGNANVDTTNGRTRFKHLGIASYTGNGTFTSQVIQTNIPKDSTIMPSIDLKGYAYDTGNTVDVQIGLYTYTIPSGSIINTVWQSKGTSSPLAIRAGWNSANLLALEITWAASDDYFNRYGIDAYSDGNSGAQQDSWFENWVITNTLFDATITQIVTIANKDKVVTLPFATPAQTIAGTATNLIVNPAGLTAKLANQPAAGACTDREDVVWNGTVLQGAAKHYTLPSSHLPTANSGALAAIVPANSVLCSGAAVTITNPSNCRSMQIDFTDLCLYCVYQDGGATAGGDIQLQVLDGGGNIVASGFANNYPPSYSTPAGLQVRIGGGGALASGGSVILPPSGSGSYLVRAVLFGGQISTIPSAFAYADARFSARTI